MYIAGNKKGFSIIEVIIGIFIFTLGMMSLYALITSTLNLNTYNKNYVVATFLAKEQLEQVRHIRDSNYELLKRYDQIDPNESYTNSSPAQLFVAGKYYTIENNYADDASFPSKVTEISSFAQGVENLETSEMLSYRLCLDDSNRYVYCAGALDVTPTHFYKFMFVDDVKYLSGEVVETIDSSLKFKSKVIWYQKGYHEFEVDSVITDWKRL